MKEFQVLICELRSLTLAEANNLAGAKVKNGDAVAPAGKPEVLFVQAEKESDVRKMFARYHIEHVAQTRVVVDREQNVFNLEEAAEYMRCSTDQIGRYMATGKLPKAREGYPKFLRRWLDKLIEDELMAVPEEKAA
jgi:hypothetical protein